MVDHEPSELQVRLAEAKAVEARAKAHRSSAWAGAMVVIVLILACGAFGILASMT